MNNKIKQLLIITVIPFLFACEDNRKTQNENYEQTQRCISATCNLYKNGRIYTMGNNSYQSSKAMFTDFDTLESAPLCARPNCSHDNSECVANLVGNCPVIYNDYVYFFTSEQGVEELGNGEREFYINSKLQRISMETSELHTVTEFHDCVPETSVSCYLSNDELYFIGSDMGPSKDEYGNIAVSNVGGKQLLGCINLDTGIYTNYGSIYDGDEIYGAASSTRSAVIIGMYDSKILINYSFQKKAMSVEEQIEAIENGADLRDTFTILTFEFDLNNKTLSAGDSASVSYADDNILVAYDYDKKLALINNGEEYCEIECDARYNTSLINGKLFTLDSGKWYDLSDKSEHDMGEYSDYQAIAYHNDYYILANGEKTAKLTETDLLSLE